ncbi:MAG: hypothetical protein KKA84_13215 [Bacteroidetes bacterium]|nr:hypothetical protein [Bacteroidota bacterium]
MGISTEGIVFLSLSWGLIFAVAGYFTTKIVPLKKLKKNGIDLIRKWSVS